MLDCNDCLFNLIATVLMFTELRLTSLETTRCLKVLVWQMEIYIQSRLQGCRPPSPGGDAQTAFWGFAVAKCFKTDPRSHSEFPHRDQCPSPSRLRTNQRAPVLENFRQSMTQGDTTLQHRLGVYAKHLAPDSELWHACKTLFGEVCSVLWQ